MSGKMTSTHKLVILTCDSGYEYSVYHASDYLELLSQRDRLRGALLDAAHRVRWLMQFASIDGAPINNASTEQELAKWDLLASRGSV